MSAITVCISLYLVGSNIEYEDMIYRICDVQGTMVHQVTVDKQVIINA